MGILTAPPHWPDINLLSSFLHDDGFRAYRSAGGSSLFSLFAGKGEQKNMNRSFGNALLLVVVFEVFLSVFLLIFSNPILKIFGVTETAYEYALAYYRIVTLGCLFQGLTQVFCDYVRVSGRPCSWYVCHKHWCHNKYYP